MKSLLKTQNKSFVLFVHSVVDYCVCVFAGLCWIWRRMYNSTSRCQWNWNA